MSMHGCTSLGLAPQGCWYNNGRAGCMFLQWTPPLFDEDFGPGKIYDFSLNGITGGIPAGVGITVLVFCFVSLQFN